MITKLIVDTEKDKHQFKNFATIDIKNDIAASVIDNKVTLSVGDILKSLKLQYITSINQVPPDDFNNIELLGDMCTSVVSSIDPDFAQFGSEGITLFDGCQACSSCQSIAKMQDDIKNIQIWLSGMKDCQLYYQDGAFRLWNDMLQKKRLYMQNIQSCVNSSQLKRQFKAIRLLYQYKALVYMWNYIVFLKAGNTQIIPAYQAYSGFVVRSKRAIDTCDSQSIPIIQLHIQIQLVQGQVAENLKDLQMYIHTCIVQQNTQVQVNSPLASIKKQTPIQSDIQVKNTNVKAVIKFQFNQSCKGIFSGGIKILPVIGPKGLSYNKDGIQLQQYIKLRNKSKYITQEQQLKVNRWQAKVWWQYPNFGSEGKIDDTSSSQTKVYTTGYSSYPQEENNENGFFK